MEKTQQSIKNGVCLNIFVAVDDSCDGIGEELIERYNIGMSSTSLIGLCYSIETALVF